MAAGKSKPLKYNTAEDAAEKRRERALGPSYKWIALSNTTIGALMATIDGSILIISLPAIFKGIGINPLAAGNVSLLLWLLLGYTIISTVTVVTIGRLSDMFGRVRLYNLGFLIFTLASIALYAASYLTSGAVAAELFIALRFVQGLGGGFLLANGAAILTDAFPLGQRGRALGINQIAAVGGSIIGLVVGGILSAIDWHLIFLISVPVGIIGTVWAYVGLHELATIRKKQKVDVIGNVTFAAAVLSLLLSFTYGLQPYGSSSVGWSNPAVDAGLLLGFIMLAVFIFVETRVRDPMINLSLFRIRAFAAGNISLFLAGMARGGLQFMMIIWLQGIWLPLHGISYMQTPFYSALDLIPLAAGFLISGPLFGYLSDRYGSRLFATLGMLLNAVGFIALATLPVNFNYIHFALILLFMGIGQGMFIAPNTSSIMSSVPPEYRGTASGIRATLFNLSFVFSIALFFSLLTLGVASTLPAALYNGLVAQNVSSTVALQVSRLPPTAALFAALLGENPMKAIIPQSSLSALPMQNTDVLLGNSFFPSLISAPFLEGIRIVFYTGIVMVLVAAICSALRGKNIPFTRPAS